MNNKGNVNRSNNNGNIARSILNQNSSVSNSVVTKAGLKPSKQELPFDITTAEASRYLQMLFDVMAKAMRESGKKGYDEAPTVQVIGAPISRDFAPLLLIMDTRVMQEPKGKKKNNQNELSMFHPESTNSSVLIKEGYIDIIKKFRYDKNEANAFKSSEYRNFKGVSRNEAERFAHNTSPKLFSPAGKRSGEYVICFINPVILFWDMTMIGPKEEAYKYQVIITGFNPEKHKAEGDYVYHVKRVIKKQKNRNRGGNPDFYRSLMGRVGVRVNRERITEDND